MAQYHEVKEITQLEETLLTFQLQNYTDDLLRDRPLAALPVVVTAGNQVYQPTFRFKVKAKEDDPDAYSLWTKLCPPYPDNAGRFGIGFRDWAHDYLLSGGILYIDGQPWWRLYQSSWPPGYTYSATTPPTNWDATGGYGTGFSWQNAFDLAGGEVSFKIYRYDSWFPPGDYLGTIEVWTLGNGTPPASPPNLVLQCTVRINKTLLRSPFF